MPTTRIELVTSNYKLPILPTKLNRHFYIHNIYIYIYIHVSSKYIYIYIAIYILLIITYIYIFMIFRRLERPLTQMKTEGFTIKLKDPLKIEFVNRFSIKSTFQESNLVLQIMSLSCDLLH